MAVIFRYNNKAYSYCIVDGKVCNYEVYEDPYQGLCETKEEEEALEAFFEYLEDKKVEELLREESSYID